VKDGGREACATSELERGLGLGAVGGINACAVYRSMFDPTQFLLFLAASAALILTPGPAVLYILARSMSQGRAAGLVSVLGVGVGNAVHAVAAAAGLSAMLASSAMAFAAVKYAGAAYLIWLGIKKLVGCAQAAGEAVFARESLRRVWSQGVVVGVFNPKTALFFLAFLPQFVDPARGWVWLQLLTLGLLFVVMAVASDSMYALLAGSVGRWLQGRRFFRQGERYVTGSVYCGLGALSALSGGPGKGGS